MVLIEERNGQEQLPIVYNRHWKTLQKYYDAPLRDEGLLFGDKLLLLSVTRFGF
jgi:hypothetical protein